MSSYNKVSYDELYEVDLENLFKEEKKTTQTKNKISEKEIIDPEDCLYDKSVVCPVCDNKFKMRAVRKGKARFIGNDIDLRPNYEPISPEYYAVIICDNCGYAAISSKFSRISDKQAKLIIELITSKFIPKKYPRVYDLNAAIERYKFALVNAAAKKAKAGEKAYICLKIGWLYREKKDTDNELKYLKSAVEGFNLAFTNENFPICGLDENTLLYIMSALYFKLGKFSECKILLGRLIVKRGLPDRLKKSAEDLRDLVKKIKK